EPCVFVVAAQRDDRRRPVSREAPDGLDHLRRLRAPVDVVPHEDEGVAALERRQPAEDALERVEIAGNVPEGERAVHRAMVAESPARAADAVAGTPTRWRGGPRHPRACTFRFKRREELPLSTPGGIGNNPGQRKGATKASYPSPRRSSPMAIYL